MSVQDVAIFLGGFLLLSARTGSAQVLMPGPCPDVTVKTPFVASQYVGLWYEIEKYFFIFEYGTKCVTAEYSGTLTLIGVKNRAINILTGARSEIEGVAKPISATEGRYLVRFPNVPGNFRAPYYVLDTDYTNYSVVWSCNNFGVFHLEYAWILTRARDPPASAMANAYAVLSKNQIKKEYLFKTDQTNCPN